MPMVKLSNTGLSTRIFHDIKGKQHVAKVGGSATLEVHDRVMARLERGQAKGEPIGVERVGPEADAPHFTLRPGEGLQSGEPGMGSAQQAAALDNAVQPQTRRELEGGTPRPPVLAEDIPPERLHNPIKANATNQAVEGQSDPNGGDGMELLTEPATIQDLIAAMEGGGLSEADTLRLSRQMLPGHIKLPQRPKPAQIMNALRRAAAAK